MSNFEQQTVDAIKGLQQTFRQLISRQIALTAMVRAVAVALPHSSHPRLREEFEAEVDHQAAQIPPAMQAPQYWEEFVPLLDALCKQQPPPSNQPPWTGTLPKS